jgi:hypothetical protein
MIIMGYPKAESGSDAYSLYDWNKYYEMYKNNGAIKDMWDDLFYIRSTADRYDFFELAKMFKPEAAFDEFDEFLQYANELFWGFIDKIPSARTKKDVKKAEKRFAHFMIGFW